MSVYDEKWVRGTLEVIINHYKELEDEIRVVRQEYEAILNDAVKPEAEG